MSDGFARLGLAVGSAIVGGMLGFGAMGAYVGFLAGSVLGTIIFPMDNKVDMPRVGEYPIQNSNKGQPIPFIYGTVRLAGNIIWMGPLQRYTVKQDSGQGGKGGEGESSTYEIRYKRSFLIAVCEGDTWVRRCWKGKTEIGLDEFTWYSGEDNNGVSDVIGEDYAEYKKLSLAYFENYKLGTSQAIPNFVFEVSRSYIGWDTTFLCENGKIGVLDQEWNYSSRSFPGAGAQDVEIDHFGNVMVNDGTADPPSIPRWDRDGIRVDDFYQFEGFPYGEEGVHHIALTYDNKYMYAIVNTIFPAHAFYVYKFNQKTGAQIWRYDWYESLFSGSCVDSLGNYYVGAGEGVLGVQIFTFDGSLGMHYEYPTGAFDAFTIRDMFIDESDPVDPILYCGGMGLLFPANRFHLWKMHLNDVLNVETFSFGSSDTDSVWGIVRKGRYLYVASGPMSAGTVHKFDLDLNRIASYDTGNSAGHIWLDWKNRITVSGSTENLVYIFDDDLNLIESHYSNTASWWAGGEGQSVPTGYSTYNATDENPALIIKDMLLDGRYAAGISESGLNLDTFTDVADYCYDNSILLSLVIKDQKPLWDHVDYILSHFGGYRYRSDGKICLGVFKDTTSAFSLTRDNLVVDEGEDANPPVQIKKRKYTDTYNRVEVAWTDRDNDYDAAVAVANDETDQRISGQLRKTTINLAGITNASLAQQMAYRLLIDSLYRHTFYSFILSYQNMLLEVGDVGTLSDGELLDSVKMRIVSVSEDVNGRGLAIEAVEDIEGLYPDITFTTQQTERTPEPAITLVDGIVSFWENELTNVLSLCIAPGGEHTNGWYVYRSYDDISYELVGRGTIDDVTSGDGNSYGVTTTNLSAATAVVYRQYETVTVDVGLVTDLDTAITDAQFFNNKKLAKIDDEIIAYQSCVENSATEWEITGLIRGLFGTEPVAHSAGAVFATLDTNFSYAYGVEDIGLTLYFKVVTFYGDDIQDIADVSSFSHTLKGSFNRPAGASLIRLDADENDGGSVEYAGATFELYWNLGSKDTGFNHGGYDVHPSYPIWRYGDDVAELIPSNGVPYGNYIVDSELQGVDLVFEEPDGTPIGQRSIAVLETETITLATDLGGNDPAVVKVMPRRATRTIAEHFVTVDQL